MEWEKTKTEKTTIGLCCHSSRCALFWLSYMKQFTAFHRNASNVYVAIIDRSFRVGSMTFDLEFLNESKLNSLSHAHWTVLLNSWVVFHTHICVDEIMFIYFKLRCVWIVIWMAVLRQSISTMFKVRVYVKA